MSEGNVRSNLDEYERYGKRELIELLQIFGRQAMVLDGLWFLEYEARRGHEEALAADIAVWEKYGRNKTKRLMSFMGITRLESLEEVARLYLLTPIWGNLGGRVEMGQNQVFLYIVDCLPQIARIRKGLGEFACKGVGVGFFAGMVQAGGNPNLRIDCEFCPPDPRPNEQWCRWRAYFADPQPGV